MNLELSLHGIYRMYNTCSLYNVKVQCPLDVAAALPIATSTALTNLRQQINSDLAYNDLKISVFTSRLRHGHRLGCDVVLVLILVLFRTFSFWSNFL